MAFVRIVVQEFPAAPANEEAGVAMQTALQGAPGLQRWIAAGDPEIGRGVAISVWDTREQAEVGIEAVLPDIRPQTAAAGRKVLSTHVYPVVIDVMPEVRA